MHMLSRYAIRLKNHVASTTLLELEHQQKAHRRMVANIRSAVDCHPSPLVRRYNARRATLRAARVARHVGGRPLSLRGGAGSREV